MIALHRQQLRQRLKALGYQSDITFTLLDVELDSLITINGRIIPKDITTALCFNNLSDRLIEATLTLML